MLRDQPLSSGEANARILAYKPYKLPDNVHVPVNLTVDEFVERFVTDWAIHYPTIYAITGQQQCRRGARRSLGDITRVAQYYLGDNKVSVEMVKNALKKLLNEKKIDTLICQEQLKRVYFIRPSGPQYKHIDERDEFGWKMNLEKKTKIPKKYSVLAD